jgi:siroheme synthase (precorrin-2 oxidase/ferrochelatase)
MDGEADKTALRRELEEVEADVAELRDTAQKLRAQIGDRSYEPTDASERAALITAAEEQEALAETLEARRDKLRKLVEEQN